MADNTSLPRYDWRRSYDWNYEHAPSASDVPFSAESVRSIAAPTPEGWRFCGMPVASPLGVPAGPLLNGRWCLYYARLGFDVVTYKTVRSRERPCYPLPNLQPVQCDMLRGDEQDLISSPRMHGSWAVSFGMPSKDPAVWTEDVRWTRQNLGPRQLLSVSVVGTVPEDWGLEELAEDYGTCARLAVEHGADCIETNFSCPNVSTCDGQLYQQPSDSATVARKVREVIGASTPYLAKVGHLADRDAAARLVDALAGTVNALASTNSIATTVMDAQGQRMFAGQRRGICGAATREASLRQVVLLRDEIERAGVPMELVGVGGAENAEHVRQYLNAGAHAVHLATAAMVDPGVGLKIREHWEGGTRRREDAKETKEANVYSSPPPPLE